MFPGVTAVEKGHLCQPMRMFPDMLLLENQCKVNFIR